MIVKTAARVRRKLVKLANASGSPLVIPRRVTPVSGNFALDRGKPIDRYYIEDFVSRSRFDVRGAVLEAGPLIYAKKYGEDRVCNIDVIYPSEGFPGATIVGDLVTGKGIESNNFDCLILTQVFPFIYDIHSAVQTCYRSLRPNGVVLATVCGTSQISKYERRHWGDFWRFTDQSAARLFGDVFGPENVHVETHGNVLVACAFLMGLAQSELTKKELDYKDPNYQVLITIRATKPAVSSI